MTAGLIILAELIGHEEPKRLKATLTIKTLYDAERS
jgi:hypothetical protein